MNTCRWCGKDLSPEWQYCPHCGKSVQNKCGKCGETIENNWIVCPYCGEKVTHIQENDFQELLNMPLKVVVKKAVEDVERRLIMQALELHDGNVTQAAKSLQISRKSLQNKMREYDLRDE